MASWKNKAAVICGGSSGLGFGLAQELVRQHARLVVLLGRDSARLDAALVELRMIASQSGSATIVEVISADLTNTDSTQKSAEAIGRLSVDIDLVIQCIGVSDRGTIAQLSRQKLLELIDANVVTSLHAIQAFSPLLIEHRGVMVLIGSLSSLFAPRFLGGYSMAKHALAALAQQARLELADSGVHLMLCCPGPIERSDAGIRYGDLNLQGIPREALQPGGGAKIKRLDPAKLSKQILDAAGKRYPMLIIPKKAWWLRFITACSQSLGEHLLKNKTS